jgi:Ca2+-transporting ATPase
VDSALCTARCNEIFLRAAALCNDASADGQVGDPTETALVLFARENGAAKEDLQARYKRVGEVPFDSVRKLMSTVNEGTDGDGRFVFTKGATDELLERCTRYDDGGRTLPLTPEIRERIAGENRDMAEKALRVLAFAYKPVNPAPAPLNSQPSTFNSQPAPAPFSDIESDLIFLGLAGMSDPVRPEVAEAVRKCRRAGVRPIMITGDHVVTAIAIGRELGILQDASGALTGKQLDALTDAEFEAKLDRISVYARVSPANKVRIVKAWRARGKICAMTGDGVNDAPALKTADIGVGMGITGTDVTKSVADVVLADDNFATIVVAVEEGRKIYANIKKAVQFLLSTNLTEVMILLFSAVFALASRRGGLQIIAAVQILWVNLVTDLVPALGLGMEKVEKNVMEQPPRSIRETVFSGGVGVNIACQSVLMAALVLASYFIGLALPAPENAVWTPDQAAATMAFLTLSLIQIAHSFNLKSLRKSVLNRNLADNKVLLFGGLGVSLATVLLVYIPGVNAAFQTIPLGPYHLLITLALSLTIIPAVELMKLLRRK